MLIMLFRKDFNMKKNLKAIFATLFVFILSSFSLSISPPVFAYTSEEILNMTKMGVGVICHEEVKWDDKNQCNMLYTYYGSFFAVGKKSEPVQYLVTNCHCVQNEEGNIVDGLYVYTNDKNKTYSVSVIKYDVNYDYAILKSNEPLLDIYPLSLAEEDANLNDTAYIIGFPVESMITSVDGQKHINVEPDNPTPTKGEITGIDINYTDNGKEYKDQYRMSAYVAGGNSGGPIVNEEGYVIGAVRAKIINEQVSFGVKISHIKDALKRCDIDYETEEIPSIAIPPILTNDSVPAITTEISNENSIFDNLTQSQLTTLKIIILIALLVVSIIIIYAVMKPEKSKNTKSEKSKSDEKEDDLQEAKTEPKDIQDTTAQKTKPYIIYKYILTFYIKSNETQKFTLKSGPVELSSKYDYQVNSINFGIQDNSLDSSAINNATVKISASDDGHKITISSSDCKIVVWNQENKKPVNEITLSHSNHSTCLEVNKDEIINLFVTDTKYLLRIERKSV